MNPALGKEGRVVAHTITLVPRCTHVRVWVPARVGDALARDTTVTRSKRAGGEARKGRGVKFRKGNQADRCVYTNTESSLLVCEHVKRRLACRKKKKKKRHSSQCDTRERALLCTSMYIYRKTYTFVRQLIRWRKVEREGEIQVDWTEIRIEKCETSNGAKIGRVQTYPCTNIAT